MSDDVARPVALTSSTPNLSIGVQSEPRIGVQKGPFELGRLFFVRRRGVSPSRPDIAKRRAQRRSTLAEGTTIVARSGVDGRLKEVSAPLAAAIRYTLNHWQGLTVFLADGRVEGKHPVRAAA
ncbi:hypothetical protein [Rhodomicrobium vannielii]|uniref:hypothetical protein n=1 Tax=Rhodomicrobium vannielii TaxID=1069 RepID=UPI0005A12F96|nr:hypothetical protein [Rhodomicrobium vannielii]